MPPEPLPPPTPAPTSESAALPAPSSAGPITRSHPDGNRPASTSRRPSTPRRPNRAPPSSTYTIPSTLSVALDPLSRPNLDDYRGAHPAGLQNDVITPIAELIGLGAWDSAHPSIPLRHEGQLCTALGKIASQVIIPDRSRSTLAGEITSNFESFDLRRECSLAEADGWRRMRMIQAYRQTSDAGPNSLGPRSPDGGVHRRWSSVEALYSWSLLVEVKAINQSVLEYLDGDGVVDAVAQDPSIFASESAASADQAHGSTARSAERSASDSASASHSASGSRAAALAVPGSVSNADAAFNEPLERRNDPVVYIDLPPDRGIRAAQLACREAICQGTWYIVLARHLRGTRLGIAMVNTTYTRILSTAEGDILIEHRSGDDTASVDDEVRYNPRQLAKHTTLFKRGLANRCFSKTESGTYQPDTTGRDRFLYFWQLGCAIALDLETPAPLDFNQMSAAAPLQPTVPRHLSQDVDQPNDLSFVRLASERPATLISTAHEAEREKQNILATGKRRAQSARVSAASKRTKSTHSSGSVSGQQRLAGPFRRPSAASRQTPNPAPGSSNESQTAGTAPRGPVESAVKSLPKLKQGRSGALIKSWVHAINKSSDDSEHFDHPYAGDDEASQHSSGDDCSNSSDDESDSVMDDPETHVKRLLDALSEIGCTVRIVTPEYMDMAVADLARQALPALPSGVEPVANVKRSKDLHGRQVSSDSAQSDLFPITPEQSRFKIPPRSVSVNGKASRYVGPVTVKAVTEDFDSRHHGPDPIGSMSEEDNVRW